MWVFTKYGFFSAVCARQGKGEPGQPVDPDRIMVRARGHALHDVWSVMYGLQNRR